MKHIFIILFTLFSLILTAQNSVEVKSYEFNFWQLYIDQTGISFYYLVKANTDNSKNMFYYDIYLFNNTYCELDPNCATYISDINLNVMNIGSKKWTDNLLYLPYVLVSPPKSGNNGVHHIAYIYSPTPVRNVKISWEKLDIY